MAKIEVQIVVIVDTDEYVEPTPKFEDDPRGFVKGLVQELIQHGGLAEESRVDVYCAQLDNRRVMQDGAFV